MVQTCYLLLLFIDDITLIYYYSRDVNIEIYISKGHIGSPLHLVQEQASDPLHSLTAAQAHAIHHKTITYNSQLKSSNYSATDPDRGCRLIKLSSSMFIQHLLYLLLFLFFLFLLLEGLCCFVGSHQLSEVSNILVSLLQQIGKALILLLVNQFTITLFIFGLGKQTWKRKGWYLAVKCRLQGCLDEIQSMQNQD